MLDLELVCVKSKSSIEDVTKCDKMRQKGEFV